MSQSLLSKKGNIGGQGSREDYLNSNIEVDNYVIGFKSYGGSRVDWYNFVLTYIIVCTCRYLENVIMRHVLEIVWVLQLSRAVLARWFDIDDA